MKNLVGENLTQKNTEWSEKALPQKNKRSYLVLWDKKFEWRGPGEFFV
jgi:hypothetical protein